MSEQKINEVTLTPEEKEQLRIDEAVAKALAAQQPQLKRSRCTSCYRWVQGADSNTGTGQCCVYEGPNPSRCVWSKLSGFPSASYPADIGYQLARAEGVSIDTLLSDDYDQDRLAAAYDNLKLGVARPQTATERALVEKKNAAINSERHQANLQQQRTGILSQISLLMERLENLDAQIAKDAN